VIVSSVGKNLYFLQLFGESTAFRQFFLGMFYSSNNSATCEDNLEKAFKLRSSISLNNMVGRYKNRFVVVKFWMFFFEISMPNMVICQMLFNADGKIKKYVDASDILGCDNCLLATFWLDTPS